MKNTLFIIVAFIMLFVNANAQSDSARKFTNHHRFEISVGYGVGLSETISGNTYKTDARYWETKTMQVLPLGLTFYPVKRIGISALVNTYKFEHKYTPSTSKGRDNVGLSLLVGANYDLPYRRSIFYGGVNAGYIRMMAAHGLSGPFYEGRGYEWNVHVGYKLAMVKGRLFYFLEAGRTQVNIKPDRYPSLDLNYGVGFYPVMMGLKFRV